MAAQQQVLFTALPDKVRGGDLHLSVHIAPRLTGAITLGAFADWLDWPSIVGGLAWEVTFDAGDPITAIVTSPPPRSDLWTQLFGQLTPVKPHTFTPLDQVPVESYPAYNVAEFIRDRWTEVATSSPKEWPLLADLLPNENDVLGPLMLPRPGPIEEAIQAQLDADKFVTNLAPLASTPSIQKDFVQLLQFHRPAGPPLPLFGGIDLDFHQTLATLGQHPPLLRLLGLVVDLRISAEAASPPPLTVKVAPGPSWAPNPTGPSQPHPGLPPIVPVATRCELTATTFRAKSKGELVDGRLPFDDTARYAPIQFDIDGGAIKAVDLAQNLVRVQAAASSASPERYALPSLRSAGLSVARRDKAKILHLGLKVATVNNAKVEAPPDDPVVDAEDVTRGYHIDVWDEAEARWFPLCARSGWYRFPGEAVPIPAGDEGFVSTAATSAPAPLGTPPSDLRLPESVTRWAGWSLVAPRPGGRLANPPDAPPGGAGPPEITFDASPLDADFPLDIDVTASRGSLPRLRFGRSYRLRARAVDLAGHAVSYDRTLADPRATELIRYGRFEPVAAPPVLPTAPRTEGESLERVVLRSNWNTGASGVVSRHIVPPKVAQLLAEQHGMFDTTGPGSIVDPNSYGVIAPYPGLTPGPNAAVVPAEQGSFEASKEGVPDLDDYQGTRYFPQDLVSLPYLPDPLARGAALRFLDLPDTDPDVPVLAEFASLDAAGWPARRALRLTVSEHPIDEVPHLPPVVHSTGHINVPLAKGEVVHVRLSSHLDLPPSGDPLPKLGLWEWIKGVVSPGDVRKGQVWPITPYRTLTLVHAVRQPVLRALFHVVGGDAQFDPTRQLGDTFAGFRGALTFHRRTTAQIDLIGKWLEWIDLGPGPTTPTTPSTNPPVAPESRQALAFTINGDRRPAPGLGTNSVEVMDEGDAVAGPEALHDRHHFGDTKHRVVTYTTVATSRFAEYFAQRHVQIATPGLPVTLATNGLGVVPGSVEVKNKVTQADGAVEGAGTYVEGKDYAVTEATGTVLFDSDFPSGQEVVITFRVPPFVRPYGNESVPPTAVSIPSSARPASPKLEYVVPTFAWGGGFDPVTGETTSVRSGNGLRVYLERPWWSSGEGELLGVVLPQTEPVPNALTGSVTRIGVDPVFASGPISPLLTAANFEGVSAPGYNLSLPGVGPNVNVVGYEVGFDKVRDLWYADIRFKGVGSYFPFVRLSLARYQPNSLQGAHLSAVTLADFVQLTPNRSATVSPGPNGTRKVTVVGTGYSKAGGDPSLKPVVRATVERQVQGGDLGWEQVGSATELQELPPAPGGNYWTANVPIPVQPRGTKLRLVIEESEVHKTGIVVLGNPVLGLRLVYSDIINL